MSDIDNLEIHFKGISSLVSSHFDPDFIVWYGTIVPCQGTLTGEKETQDLG